MKNNINELIYILKDKLYKSDILIELKKYKLPEIINLFRSIVNEDKFDFINFVLPSNEHISYLSSVFICFDEVKKNYNKTLENYSEILKPGINVELCGTGKIYKYLGESIKYPNFVRIETIPFRNIGKASIEKEIKDIFQFFPTKKEINLKNLGKSDWKILETNPLDEILGIKTFKNPVFIKNQIILLTQKEKFQSFLKNQTIDKWNLDEVISSEYIDQDGKIKNNYEPLILYSSNLNSIHKYLKQDKNEKIIITDSINKISDLTLINQILDLNKCKFILFSNPKDFNEISNLYYKKKHKIWKFEKSEINQWYNTNNKKEIFNEENFSNQGDVDKIDIIFKNFVEQNIIFTDFKENIFDTLTKNLKKLNTIESENKDEIINILSDIYILKHKLQDYIFGFNQDVCDYFENSKNKIINYFNYNKNFLNNEEFNLINDIIQNLKQIDLNDSKIFENRRNELKKIFTNEHSIYNIKNTTIIADNPKIKNYYKIQIKKLWNLDIEINTTQSPKNIYEYAIVPSEFSKVRINKVIDEFNFKNINFFSTPSIKEKINEVLKGNKSKWKKFYLDPKYKVELLNLNKDYQHLLTFPEHTVYSTSTYDNYINKIDLETLLDKPFDRNKLKSKIISKDDVDSRVLIFYGNAFGYFTENTDFKLINNLFFISKVSNSLIKETNFKDLKIDDFLLIRDSSDRDLIESEAQLQFKNVEDYKKLKDDSRRWFDLLSNAINTRNLDSDDLYDHMKFLGYSKSRATLKNLVNNLTICPEELDDLKILVKSIEKLSNQDQFMLSEKEIIKIYSSSKKLKSFHRNAGRLMSKKIFNALKSKDIDVGREPVRVDYNKDGTITLNQFDTEKPEAWIVQIQEIDKKIYKVPSSELNNLQF